MAFFYQYILPVLIVGSFAGALLYMLCARLVYYHLHEHYRDALPEKNEIAFGDADDGMGAYIAAVWYASRTGGYKRIQSNTWRGFYTATRVLGAFTGVCLVLLSASFFFWTELKSLLA
ncbi:hypothetical protein [Chitinibacter tainanensis]|uniref:hypothetical protein n=1 Tax=Chitinibacter tainanensis TaxID=230667 RepID=UPI00040FCB2A|nr:hypothetical protein [Chitinibacter tainanensis]